MDSVNERYQTDIQFHKLVDMMESFIYGYEFSPSEMRQAAMLASINYEMKRIPRRVVIPDGIEASITALEAWNKCHD